MMKFDIPTVKKVSVKGLEKFASNNNLLIPQCLGQLQKGKIN